MPYNNCHGETGEIMDQSTISKPPIKDFPKEPNLKDYNNLRDTFSWDQMEAQLSGLPGGGLNLAYEAIDRHAIGDKSGKIAMYWEGNDGEEEAYTFAEMKSLSDKFANALLGLNISKSDRIFIFI